MSRFIFRQLQKKSLGSINVPVLAHDKITFIAADKKVTQQNAARVLLLVGLEEFEKEHPDYFKSKDWEEFQKELQSTRL